MTFTTAEDDAVQKIVPQHRGIWDGKAIPLTTLVLGIFSLSLVLIINFVWERQVREFITINAITDLRKDLTTFHLWLEQYLNGDSDIDIEKTRQSFIEAKKLGQALLSGGMVQTGFVVQPLEDPTHRKKAEEIMTLMEKLEEIVLIRMRDKKVSGSGSLNDKEFDKLFNVTISRAGELQEAVEKDIISALADFRKLSRIILVVWCAIIIVTAIGLGFLVTRRRNSEKELLSSQEKYRSLVDSTDDSIYLVDAACNYLFVNRKHLNRLGLSLEAMIGRSYNNFHSPEENEIFRKRIERVFSTSESAQYEHQSLRDGRYFLQTFSPVRNADSRIVAVTVVSKNITERKRMVDELTALSLTDPLTGLYNRRGFYTLAELQIKIASRLDRRLYLLVADLDNLKVINDTFGHQEGDSALIETANILKASFRESDIIARLGGDEFVVMPIEMSDDRSETVLHRLNQGFEKNNDKNLLRYRISISTGIAFFDPEKAVSLEELLREADSSMYNQKRVKKAAAVSNHSDPAPGGLS